MLFTATRRNILFCRVTFCTICQLCESGVQIVYSTLSYGNAHARLFARCDEVIPTEQYEFEIVSAAISGLSISYSLALILACHDVADILIDLEALGHTFEMNVFSEPLGHVCQDGAGLDDLLRSMPRVNEAEPPSLNVT